MTIAAKKMESGRQRAIEYGRNVPKPKVKSGSKGGDEGGGGVASNIGIELGDEYMEVARMQELEQKHAANKAQIEAMKRQMGLWGYSLVYFSTIEPMYRSRSHYIRMNINIRMSPVPASSASFPCTVCHLYWYYHMCNCIIVYLKINYHY